MVPPIDMAIPHLSEYKVLRVSKDSLKDLIPLYNAAFQKQYSIKYLLKKFDTMQFGAEYIGHIAYFRNKAVAFYTLFPCIMEYKGQSILAAQSGDTMTHPEHRKKGLFIYLAKLTYELAKVQGIKFVFGFPNDSSYEGFTKKLLWKHNEDMNLYKIKVNTLPLSGISTKNHFLKFLYASFLHFILLFYKQTKAPLNIVGYDDRIHIKHDTKYFNYKSYGSNFKLNIAGVNVWMRVNGALLVGDLEQAEDKKVKLILGRLKRLAFLIGCRDLVFSFSKEMFWNKQLSNYAIAEKGFPIAYYDLGSRLPLSKLVFSFSALDTF